MTHWRRLQGALGACLERGRRLCLQRYEKPLFSDADYRLALQKLAATHPHAPLRPQQEAAFAALFAWRDRHARELNTVPRALLPSFLLLQLAQRLPETAGEVRRSPFKRRFFTERAQEVRPPIHCPLWSCTCQRKRAGSVTFRLALLGCHAVSGAASALRGMPQHVSTAYGIAARQWHGFGCGQ